MPTAGFRIQVVLATYNEGATIGAVVGALSEVAAHVRLSGDEMRLLLVDDRSPDGTAATAEQTAKSVGLPFQLLSGPREGLGNAYLRGFDAVVDEGWADVVVTFDADGQHDPLALLPLLERFRGSTADLVIGSRWIAGGTTPGLSGIRWMLSRVGIAVFGIVTGTRTIKDPTSSYRVFTTDVARSFRPGALAISGYSFFSSFVGLTDAAGYEIVECPIVFLPRGGGVSKLMRRDVVQFGRNIGQLGRAVRAIRRAPPPVTRRAETSAT